MRKTYLLVMAAILLTAGLAVTAVLSTGAIASANEVEVMAFIPDEEASSMPETGGTALDIEPELSSQEDSSEESSQLSAEESSEGSSESSSEETLSSSSLSSQQQSSEGHSSSSSGQASSAPSSHTKPSSSTPSGPPSTEGSYTTSESSSGHSSSSSSAGSSSHTSSSSPPVSQPESSPSNTSTGETLRVSLSGQVVEGDAYTILCQIVEAEMGGSFSTEALKAQTVAVHSYIRYENAAGRTPSLPSRTPTQKTKDAVSAVLNELLYYNGSIAFTPYHASSSGVTNSSAEIWGGGYPYLTNVTSAYDPSSSYKNVQTSIAISTVREKVEAYLNITLPDDPATWFADYTANSGGYVTQVMIPDSSGGTHRVTGRQVRENILGYAIRSHAFTVTVSGDNLIFTTNGYGHGVGMSQTGANAYAVNDGWTYKQILSHYYPGTYLG